MAAQHLSRLNLKVENIFYCQYICSNEKKAAFVLQELEKICGVYSELKSITILALRATNKELCDKVYAPLGFIRHPEEICSLLDDEKEGFWMYKRISKQTVPAAIVRVEPQRQTRESFTRKRARDSLIFEKITNANREALSHKLFEACRKTKVTYLELKEVHEKADAKCKYHPILTPHLRNKAHNFSSSIMQRDLENVLSKNGTHTWHVPSIRFILKVDADEIYLYSKDVKDEPKTIYYKLREHKKDEPGLYLSLQEKKNDNVVKAIVLAADMVLTGKIQTYANSSSLICSSSGTRKYRFEERTIDYVDLTKFTEVVMNGTATESVVIATSSYQTFILGCCLKNLITDSDRFDPKLSDNSRFNVKTVQTPREWPSFSKILKIDDIHNHKEKLPFVFPQNVID